MIAKNMIGSLHSVVQEHGNEIGINVFQAALRRMIKN
jgi:hypothetical protein